MTLLGQRKCACCASERGSNRTQATGNNHYSDEVTLLWNMRAIFHFNCLRRKMLIHKKEPFAFVSHSTVLLVRNKTTKSYLYIRCVALAVSPWARDARQSAVRVIKLVAVGIKKKRCERLLQLRRHKTRLSHFNETFLDPHTLQNIFPNVWKQSQKSLTGFFSKPLISRYRCNKSASFFQ